MTAVPPALGGRPAGLSAVARTRLLRSVGIGASIIAVALVALLSLAVGSKQLPVHTVWDALFQFDGSGDQLIVRELRVPRTVLGILVGSAMALAGVLMQALTRNPLADPGILGVNTGAALAVVVAISFLGVSSVVGYVWFAMAGAAVTTVVVYLLGSVGRAGVSPARLALAGVAVAAASTGLISAIVLLDLSAFDGFRTWSVGSLMGRDGSVVWQVLPFMTAGFVIALGMAAPLNALALGDETARALGAKVGLIRLSGVAAVTLLCGAGTAAIGPIAFVGLVIPHMVRSFTGPDYRWLLPYSLLLGPILLLGSDIVGRVVMRPAELQVAVVTAAIGAPVFIMLVRRRRLAQL